MNINTCIAALLIVVGALVIITNMVVEVIKRATWDKIPTNILVVFVALVLSVVAYITYVKVVDMTMIGWHWPAVIVCGFLVAYAAMVGYDKFKEAILQWKNNIV